MAGPDQPASRPDYSVGQLERWKESLGGEPRRRAWRQRDGCGVRGREGEREREREREREGERERWGERERERRETVCNVPNMSVFI